MLVGMWREAEPDGLTSSAKIWYQFPGFLADSKVEQRPTTPHTFSWAPAPGPSVVHIIHLLGALAVSLLCIQPLPSPRQRRSFPTRWQKHEQTKTHLLIRHSTNAELRTTERQSSQKRTNVRYGQFEANFRLPFQSWQSLAETLALHSHCSI
jgi:hypothetical protein